MTGAQVREARRLLGWSDIRLTSLCGFPEDAVYKFEATGVMRRPMFLTDRVDRMAKLRSVLEAVGVEFVEVDGVRKVESSS